MSPQPYPGSSFHPAARREGSVFVLMLGVLVIGVALISAVQHAQVRRRMVLTQAGVEVELRGALLLGLHHGMERWAADPDPEVTSPREAWAQPVEREADNGAVIRISFRDPQARFNLNALTLSGERYPGLDTVFDRLLAPHGVIPSREIPRDEWESWEPLASLGELEARHPGAAGWFQPTEHGDPRETLVALPMPSSGLTRINLNSVQEEVLHALLGTSMAAWVETIVRMRDAEPLRSVGSMTSGLPPPVQARLSEVLDVRSEYMEVRVEAELGHTLRTVEALLRRQSDGEVEVIQCQW